MDKDSSLTQKLKSLTKIPTGALALCSGEVDASEHSSKKPSPKKTRTEVDSKQTQAKTIAKKLEHQERPL